MEFFSFLVHRKKWNRIYFQNGALLPTQNYSYYWHLMISLYLNNPIRLFKYRCIVLYSKTNEGECLMPLIINSWRRNLFGFSVFGHLDYDDIISTTNNPVVVHDLVTRALKPYSKYHIQIRFCRENSLLYTAFQPCFKINQNTGSIQLPGNYDDYVASLTSHQRQNIRTAYNKLSRNNKTIRLCTFNYTNRISWKLFDRLNLIFLKRHDKPISLKERFLNPYCRILRNDKNVLTFVLSDENNEPLAYMSGLMNCNKTSYHIPRLCINSEYASYSPGIILYCETIKYLIPFGVTTFDLMRGGETYKKAMGGDMQNLYKLDCTVAEMLNR